MNTARLLMLIVTQTSLISMTSQEDILTTRFNETVFSSNDTAIFGCSPPFYTISFQWIINGSFMESLNLSNVRAGVNSVEGTAALMFPDLPTAYNGTTIQCAANSSSRLAPLYSNIIQILIEDNLPAAGSLRASGLNVYWEAPFSLRYDPITYCVVVMDDSSSSNVLFSQCGISNTLSTIPSPSLQDIACKAYEITVIPVNTQGNGTATSIRTNFITSERSSLQVHRVYYSNSDQTKMAFQIQTNTSLCNVNVTLRNLDDAGPGKPFYTSSSIENSSVVAFNVAPLNHRFNATFGIENSNGSFQDHIVLSTYDIQMIDQNSLSFEYADNSKAKGAFCILLFLGDDGTVNFNRSVYLVVQRNSTTRLQIARGASTILAVYDVEYNGLLQTSRPAIMHNATGDSATSVEQIKPRSDKCNVNSQDYDVKVTCACQQDAVGYQVLVQCMDPQNVDYFFEPMVDSGNCSGTVVLKAKRYGRYRVTVIPIKEGRGILDSTVVHSEEVLLHAPMDPSRNSGCSTLLGKTFTLNMLLLHLASTFFVFVLNFS